MENPKSLSGQAGWWRRVPRSCWYAFLGALIWGLMAQGMGLLNKYSWHDDIVSLFGVGATVTSGRWMLEILAKAEVLVFGDGHFSLPLVNGLFSLCCVGLAAGAIVWLLKIRSRGLSLLLGGVMAAFPVITALFSFMFTIPYYMLAMVMMVCGGLLICAGKAWWRKGLGVLLCGCALGVYQAFLPLLPALVLLYDLSRLAEGEDVSRLLKNAGIQALCFAGVMGVYLGGSRLFLSLYHLEMDSYMGLNQVGSVTVGDYLERAGRAYREFFLPSRNVLWDMYPQHMHYVYLAMLVLDGVLGLTLAISMAGENPGRGLLAAGLLALFPLACNLIFVLSEDVHSLMVYGQVTQAALLIFLVERTGHRLPRVRRLVSGGAALLLGVGCLMYVRYDNQCYLKTTFQQQEAISWNTALVTRIKSAEGYRDELPVAWVNRWEAADPTLYNMDELNLVVLSGYEQDIQGYVNNWAWDRFLARWCGFAPETVEEDLVADWPEVRRMPAYPDDGSIQVVNDVVVVNF